jgi:hypothetical protein
MPLQDDDDAPYDEDADEVVEEVVGVDAIVVRVDAMVGCFFRDRQTTHRLVPHQGTAAMQEGTIVPPGLSS